MNTYFELGGGMVPGLIKQSLLMLIFGEKIYLEIILKVLHFSLHETFDQ